MRSSSFVTTAVALTLIGACDDGSPVDPDPVDSGPFAVDLTLAVPEGGTGYYYGRGNWALYGSSHEAIAQGHVFMDTTLAMELEEGAYSIFWGPIIVNSGGIRYRMDPVEAGHDFTVTHDTALGFATPYLISTGALRIGVEGFGAGGRVRFALRTPDGECIRCYHPLGTGVFEVVDLVPPGDYEIWWMDEEWFHDGPYTYYFSPSDTLQHITVEAGKPPIDVIMTYHQVSGAAHFYIHGLPEGATACLCMIMREPNNGGQARSGSLAAGPDGEPVSHIDVGRWVQTWLDVEFEGVTYVPSADSVSVVIEGDTQPTIVEVTYSPTG